MSESDPIKRVSMGAWEAGGNHNTHATIWLVFPRGGSFHYEANVYRAGEMIATLTAATREEATQELERRYGQGV